MVFQQFVRTSPFKGIRNYLFDLDAVWRGNRALEGAKETITELQRRGKKVYFLTNLTVLSRAGFAKKLAEIGVKVEPRQIITAGYVAAQYLLENGHSRVYVIGEKGLIDELTEVGVKITEKDPDAIFIAVDRNLTYWKLKAVRDIVDANPAIPIFSAGNRRTWAIGNETLPGDGVIQAAVEALTGRPATLIGMPSDIFKQRLLQDFELHFDNTLLIGDELATDVAFGNKFGFKTALVLTDATSRKAALEAKSTEKPDHILSNLKELLREW